MIGGRGSRLQRGLKVIPVVRPAMRPVCEVEEGFVDAVGVGVTLATVDATVDVGVDGGVAGLRAMVTRDVTIDVT